CLCGDQRAPDVRHTQRAHARGRAMVAAAVPRDARAQRGPCAGAAPSRTGGNDRPRGSRGASRRGRLSMAALRIEAIDTCVVSLPLDRPAVTPIHHITTIDCVLVTAKTDGGLSGIGYLWTFGPPRARTLEAMVRDLAQLVRGADPLETEAVWRRMWNDTNFLGHAGVSMLGISAIDTALWDIKGKALGQPLYRLLGGMRRPLPVYAGGLFLSDPIDAIVAEAKGYVARGFRAMKMRTGAKSEREDIARVEAVRAAIGPDVILMVDVVQGWTVEQAIRMGRALAPYNLFWIE